MKVERYLDHLNHRPVYSYHVTGSKEEFKEFFDMELPDGYVLVFEDKSNNYMPLNNLKNYFNGELLAALIEKLRREGKINFITYQ